MTVVRAPEESRPLPALHDDVDIDRDRVLVERAQRGDRAAFDDLYARYYLRLWRFCVKRLQDEHEAEDVVQEAFVRAWRALPGFAGERRFYPWLSVIAAHLCSNVVRKRNRADPVAELPLRDLVSLEGDGEDRAMVAHDCALAAQALARLSPRHRMILDLREEQGWSYRQIAEHQGVRISTVEALLWRAREALKREFAAQGGESRLAGVVGVLAFTTRRLLRAPQAAAERCGLVLPSAGSWVVGSAALAATAVAGVVGSLAPATAPVPGAAGSWALSSPALVSSQPDSAFWASPGATAGASTGGGVGATAASTTAPVDPPALSAPLQPAPLLAAPAPPSTPSPSAPVLPAAPSAPPTPAPPDLSTTQTMTTAVTAPVVSATSAPLTTVSTTLAPVSSPTATAPATSTTSALSPAPLPPS